MTERGSKLYSSLENLNESPKQIITEILNRKLENNTLFNSIDSVIKKMESNQHTTTPQYLDLVEKSTRAKKKDQQQSAGAIKKIC
ncbi:hypothetical protein QY896_18060 [Lactiplantibacillus plantarum]